MSKIKVNVSWEEAVVVVAATGRRQPMTTIRDVRKVK